MLEMLTFYVCLDTYEDQAFGNHTYLMNMWHDPMSVFIIDHKHKFELIEHNRILQRRGSKFIVLDIY